MNARPLLLASLALALAGTAAAGGPTTTGALATPANRIVGVWNNIAEVGPCGGPVGAPIRQTLVYHAGGTALDNAPFPPSGVPNIAGIPGVHQRSIGVGNWRYEPLIARWSLQQRFDWFVDNRYHGYQVVDRTMLLSNDGNTLSGPVRTKRYTAAGAIVQDLCGSAVSTRW